MGKKSTKKSVETTSIGNPSSEPMDYHAEVAKAAYFLAERREFAPGGELDDWLTAEQAIAQAGPSNE